MVGPRQNLHWRVKEFVPHHLSYQNQKSSGAAARRRFPNQRGQQDVHSCLLLRPERMEVEERPTRLFQRVSPHGFRFRQPRARMVGAARSRARLPIATSHRSPSLPYLESMEVEESLVFPHLAVLRPGYPFPAQFHFARWAAAERLRHPDQPDFLRGQCDPRPP
jgi:hypothetical protein